MNERKAVAIYTIPPSLLSEEIPKRTVVDSFGKKQRGNKKVRGGNTEKIPSLQLHTPNVQWCAHPGGVVLETSQEYCSSPPRHRL